MAKSKGSFMDVLKGKLLKGLGTNRIAGGREVMTMAKKKKPRFGKGVAISKDVQDF